MNFVVKRKKNSLITQVEKHLTEHDMLTRAEIAELMGVPSKALGGLLSRLGKESGPMSPQRVHIAGWIDEQYGSRRYPRAQYKLGAEKDKPKPRAKTNAERSRQYYWKVTRQVASVFDLGLKARDRMTRGLVR